MNHQEGEPGNAGSRIVKSDDQWRKELTAERSRVLRTAGTEQPFGPAYESFSKEGSGTYVCAGADGVEVPMALVATTVKV